MFKSKERMVEPLCLKLFLVILTESSGLGTLNKQVSNKVQVLDNPDSLKFPQQAFFISKIKVSKSVEIFLWYSITDP